MADKRFMYIYHGGSDMRQPETDEARNAEMARWQSWMDGIRDHIADEGAPAGKSHTVSRDGVAHDGGPNPVFGYTLVNATDIDEAIAMAKDCPMVLDGGSIEVCEAMQL